MNKTTLSDYTLWHFDYFREPKPSGDKNMSNIPVHLLYTLLGVFSFICALSIALFKQDKNKSHWFLVAIQIVWSVRMLIYAQLFNPDKCHMIWTWPVYIISSMAYAPLFYMFTTELTNIRGITRKDYMVFIPIAAITAMFLAIYLGASHNTLYNIHENVILGGKFLSENDIPSSVLKYLCYHMARTVTFWFEAGVLLWCCWCMYKYEDTVNEYFSSNYGKSVSQSRIISVLTALGVVVVLLREASPDYQQEITIQKLILILVTFIFQLALTVMAFSIDYSADDIRHMLEKGDDKRDKPVYPENRQELTITNCWKNLERLMNDEKVFLDPELNLIDLAQRLGTNRTYLSLAVRQFSGKSFSDYVNYARITYAQELLLKGESAKNVEYSCGYISSSTFYRQFQKIAGASPSVWLRQQRIRESEQIIQ
ncbi:MAG: helix-turn-helix transcriptional regulator [Bacteroidaceae bacterium]|nr:helix-turn-helix transcriptional regulator [Bacteroidaceae bacterium]